MADCPFLWAHRGASLEAPENTLAAFRAAEAAGADGIECDVQLSRDGVPVILHDGTVERTTDGRGRVDRLLLRQLRELDAGSWFAPGFAGEPLPTLEELLRWAGERLRLNLEIKRSSAAREVLELLKGFPRSRVLLSSFDHRLIGDLRRLGPSLRLGLLCETPFWHKALRRAAAAGAESFHPRHDRLSRAMLAACRREGVSVIPWTVDDPAALLQLMRLRVDGLFTNAPRQAYELRRWWWRARP